MNPVNGANNDISFQTVDPTTLNQQDLVTAVYLQRGEFLDKEVRNLVSEVDRSNQLMDAVNSIINKANVAQYGTTVYSSPTWTHENNTVVLDNGYHLILNSDGNGGQTFTLKDGEGNQLIYQDKTLIPVPGGSNIKNLEAGIPVMSDMTMLLDDGTEITFKAGTADSAFNQTNFSGGLANITSIVITRENQGMVINNIDSDSVTITGPNIESTSASATPTVTTETVTIASQDLSLSTLNGYSDDYGSIDQHHVSAMNSTWAPVLRDKSPEEQAALLEQIRAQGGVDVTWGLQDYQGENNWYTRQFNYPPHTNESLTDYFKRVMERSASEFRDYVNAQEGAISIAEIVSTVNMPGYSFEEVIPSTDKTTQSVSSVNADYFRPFYESADYNSIYTFAEEYKQELLSDLAAMVTKDDQRRGLEKTLREDGFTNTWGLQDRDGDHNYYEQTHTWRMVSGESLDDFIERITQQSAVKLENHIANTQNEGNIAIESIRATGSLPAFTYDEYEAEDSGDASSPRAVHSHAYDQNNNDGHLLLESGGVHAWEYGGTDVSLLSRENPNDSEDQVDGFFGRKLTFKDGITNEFSGTTPLLTQKEIDILAKDLNISYSDASGSGQLTAQEWATLRESLGNARDSLTSNSQLKTVELQRALTTYNQNYDAMSNAQNKIYSLLRDIMNNIK